MKHLFVSLILLFTLANCGQTPFPDEALYASKQPKMRDDGYSLTFQDIMEFHELQLTGYAIKAVVPEGGKSVIEVSGLPAGAHFSPDLGVVEWSPPKGAAKQGNQPFATMKVQIGLRSSVDPKTVLARSALWVIYPEAK